MKNSIKIPVAIQMRVDDVGWHNGSDDRWKGQPSRSGLPRKHNVLDYGVLNEIGKAVNMKINCSLVLGEWDKDNILRGQENVTYNKNGWNRKEEIDYDYANKAFEILENGEYLSYTYHSLLHGFYYKDKLVTEKVMNPYRYDAEKDEYIKGGFVWHSEEEFRRHLDLFFKIYNSWGFTKPVKSFACPCGCWGSPEDEGNIMYGNIIREYGMKVWENGWGSLKDRQGIGVTGGAVCLRAGSDDPVAWDAYDVDPDLLSLHAGETGEQNPDFCIHWTNLLRWNPEKNMENVPKWINFLKRQSEVFGTMLSRDVFFAGSQAIYKKYAKMEFEEGKCIIDFTDVDKSGAEVLKNEFYISFKNNIIPSECIGGRIELYEEKKEFKTYKITRSEKGKITILF